MQQALEVPAFLSGSKYPHASPPRLLFIFAIFRQPKIFLHNPHPPCSATTAARREHAMVGLSVVLENHETLSEKRSPQIISKGSMIKSSSNTTPSSPSVFSNEKSMSSLYSVCGFLDYCFLCNQKLLPGKDIYMYKGDEAFCSVECRYRQIFMDEEETSAKSGCTVEYNCSMTASSSSSSSSSSSRGGKGARDRAFAY